MTPRNQNLMGRVAACLALVLGGCHRDMYDQPRLDPLEPSEFFEDGRASRPRVEGVVEFGATWAGDVLHTGRSGDEPSLRGSRRRINGGHGWLSWSQAV